ncbi:lactoylglutathione lyase [Bradyrhizobium sp. 26S5]|uniref:lactoylglutathione lyase n=1 Tax=unclassified Bradyrhizobium TaxID=2631580 RepID=UPI00140ABE8B|nr:lactoylglutathione lyase [Bradyrhizobium sp. 2S1]MCK7669647.1 lactoylglutathione lyase [Bradyrhizobium sp. 2S1]
MNRILYTMIRVGDLERSISFYKQLGMTELRRRDVPEGRYTLAFLGYGEAAGSGLELTYNYGIETYEHGNAFGQLVIEVPDIYDLCGSLRAAGVKIRRDPGPVKFGTSIIAFVEDPDGYKVELIQHARAASA